MRRSVQQVHQTVASATRNGNRGRRIIPNSRIVGVDTADVRDSRKQDQFGHLAAIERQLQHALVVDHLTDGRSSRFQ